MAHQVQASCDQACQVHEHGATHSERKEQGNDDRKGQTAIQISVSKKAERLDVDKGLTNISEYKKIRRYGPVGLELAPDFVQSGKELLNQSRRVGITNEFPMGNSGNLLFPDVKAEQSDSLYICKLSGFPAYQDNCVASSFPYFGNTRSEQQHFPKFNFSQKLENILPPYMELPIFNRHPFRHQIAVKSGYNAINVGSSNSNLLLTELALPPTEIRFQVEGTVQRLEQQKQPYDSPDKKVLSVQTFKDDLTGSTSNSVPCGFKSRGLNIRSHARQKDEKDQPSFGLACKEPVANTRFTLTEDEHHNCHSCYTFVASDEMDKGLIAKASRNPSARKKDGVLKLNDNSLTDDFHLPVLVGEQGRGIKNVISRLPLSHSSTPAHHLLRRMPSGSLHDVETLQICSTVDSVEGVPGRPPKLSKTTHHLLITKKTDVNLSKGDQLITKSAASAEFKRSSFHEMIAVPPVFYSQGKDKAKFQHLGNSTDSEEKQDGNAITTGFLRIQNESSAETDNISLGVNQSRPSLPGMCF
ncbi:uncharacterized protein LOC131235726 isoform X2 [Magnolia sinica]|nr:uncharacterized protein LOC131235726 isoform X2 [Magnolia sinica]XP_058089040.1 uncharacterized protein LOC131235726 isoform X2 [Magnolia sinica]